MILPTSSVQRAIAADERDNPGAHQVSFYLELDRPVGRGQLAAALRLIQARNPLLRSTFHEVGGWLERRVHEELPIPIEAGTEMDIPAALRRPIDSRVAPPVRVLLFAMPTGVTRLHVLLHHHAYDAVTVAGLMRELLEALGGMPLGEPWVDHAAFVEAEATADRDALRAQVLRRLGGRPLRLPLPDLGPARVQHAARAAWAADDAPGPRVLARLVAGWWLTLADWLGRDDLVLGTTTSLRRRHLRSVFGPAFQYVPLAPAIRRGMDLYPAIEAARADLMEAVAAAWLPLEELGPRVGPQLGLNANLNFYDVDRFTTEAQRQMRRGGAAEFGGIGVRELPVPEAEIPRPYDLNLGVTRSGGRLLAQLRYRPDLLDAAEAQGLLAAMAERLDGVRRAA